MNEEEKEKKGKIARIENFGYGIIVDEEGKEYFFTLDKVEGYQGQTVQALRWKKGNPVHFSIQNGKVSSVKVLKNSDKVKGLVIAP